MKLYHCLNIKKGCKFTGTKSEVIKHLKRGCLYTNPTKGILYNENNNPYKAQDSDFFDTALTAYVVGSVLFSDSKSDDAGTFEGGKGGDSGGAGATGSWTEEKESNDNLSQNESEESSSNESSENSDL